MPEVPQTAIAKENYYISKEFSPKLRSVYLPSRSQWSPFCFLTYWMTALQRLLLVIESQICQSMRVKWISAKMKLDFPEVLD